MNLMHDKPITSAALMVSALLILFFGSVRAADVDLPLCVYVLGVLVSGGTVAALIVDAKRHRKGQG